MGKILAGVERAGGIMLVAVGIGAALLGVFVEDREAVAVPLVVLGLGLVGVGALLDRIEGSFKVGLQGLEATLRKAVEKKAKERQLPREEREEALERASATAFDLWSASVPLATGIPAVKSLRQADAPRFRMYGGGTVDRLAEEILSPEVRVSEPFTFSSGDKARDPEGEGSEPVGDG